MYVCYLVKYSGDKLPPYYIGSTSLKKIKNGYRGSVVSKRYSEIFKSEIKNNFNLFDYEILSEHVTREEALEEELRIQQELNVVKSNDYFNQSYAVINGMFGRDVSGELNPMYGKQHLESSKKIISKKRGVKKRYEITEEHRKIISSTHKNKIVSYETREKMSESKKGNITVKDKYGNFINVSKFDDRFLNGELSGITAGLVCVKDINDNRFMVSVNDDRYINGELVHIKKGVKTNPPSGETRKKISEANMGRVPSEETRKKISEANTGKKNSEETRKKISEANTGKKMSKEAVERLIKSKTGMKYIESVCPHCEIIGRGGNMKRYHFDNCKLKIK